MNELLEKLRSIPVHISYVPTDYEQTLLYRQCMHNAQNVANATGWKQHLFCVPGPFFQFYSEEIVHLVLDEMADTPLLIIEPESDEEPQDPTDVGLWSDEPGFPLGEETSRVNEGGIYEPARNPLVFTTTEEFGKFVEDEQGEFGTGEIVAQEHSGRMYAVRVSDGFYYCNDGHWRDCSPCPVA